MGFAHTRELDYGLITAKAKTSKPFMIQPNMPRFVRVGDRTTLMASLNNLSAETVSGVARMITAKAKTSKPFMIQPNMPRFVRVGDRTTLMASLNNLSAETVSGVARMQLADPITGKVVYSGQQPFRVEAGEKDQQAVYDPAEYAAFRPCGRPHYADGFAE